MKVTPPLAVAPLAHGDDMRWNPRLVFQLMNDNGIAISTHEGIYQNLLVA